MTTKTPVPVFSKVVHIYQRRSAAFSSQNSLFGDDVHDIIFPPMCQRAISRTQSILLMCVKLAETAGLMANPGGNPDNTSSVLAQDTDFASSSAGESGSQDSTFVPDERPSSYTNYRSSTESISTDGFSLKVNASSVGSLSSCEEGPIETLDLEGEEVEIQEKITSISNDVERMMQMPVIISDRSRSNTILRLSKRSSSEVEGPFSLPTSPIKKRYVPRLYTTFWVDATTSLSSNPEAASSQNTTVSRPGFHLPIPGLTLSHRIPEECVFANSTLTNEVYDSYRLSKPSSTLDAQRQAINQNAFSSNGIFKSKSFAPRYYKKPLSINPAMSSSGVTDPMKQLEILSLCMAGLRGRADVRSQRRAILSWIDLNALFVFDHIERESNITTLMEEPYATYFYLAVSSRAWPKLLLIRLGNKARRMCLLCIDSNAKFVGSLSNAPPCLVSCWENIEALANSLRHLHMLATGNPGANTTLEDAVRLMRDENFVESVRANNFRYRLGVMFDTVTGEVFLSSFKKMINSALLLSKTSSKIQIHVAYASKLASVLADVRAIIRSFIDQEDTVTSMTERVGQVDRALEDLRAEWCEFVDSADVINKQAQKFVICNAMQGLSRLNHCLLVVIFALSNRPELICPHLKFLELIFENLLFVRLDPERVVRFIQENIGDANSSSGPFIVAVNSVAAR